jgi:hypothetical protein
LLFVSVLIQFFLCCSPDVVAGDLLFGGRIMVVQRRNFRERENPRGETKRAEVAERLKDYESKTFTGGNSDLDAPTKWGNNQDEDEIKQRETDFRFLPFRHLLDVIKYAVAVPTKMKTKKTS